MTRRQTKRAAVRKALNVRRQLRRVNMREQRQLVQRVRAWLATCRLEGVA